MADTDAKLGLGLFTNVSDNAAESNRFSSMNFKLTPKYNDPYSDDTKRRMAKFLISSELKSLIDLYYAKGASDSGQTKNDAYLQRLSQERGYFDFFLQSVEEQFDEKFQIVETLGDSYAVFGIGKKPRIFNFSGVLLNTKENDWRINFIKIFEQYLSVSMLAKFQAKTKGTASNTVTLIYDSMVLSGAILRLRTGLQAQSEMNTPFAFAMLVTKMQVQNESEFQSFNIQEYLGTGVNVAEVTDLNTLSESDPNQLQAVQKKKG